MLRTKTFVPVLVYGAAGIRVAAGIGMSAQKTEEAWIVPLSVGMA